MQSYQEYLIQENNTLEGALTMLSNLSEPQALFVTNELSQIIGTLTDGDIRRALLKGFHLKSIIKDFYFKDFISLTAGEYDINKLTIIQNKKIRLVPVLNKEGLLQKLIDFEKVKTVLPIQAVIMAGGLGKRLMPLTEKTPKPMLPIAGKPIIEYNIDLLMSYGVTEISISVNHLSHIIEDYFKDGSKKGVHISYIQEDQPYGTIGAIRQKKDFKESYVLVMNSDLLTNIDLDGMFELMMDQQADMVIATIDYNVQIPYGVIETQENTVMSLREKPTYTYYSNAGIYILKREIIHYIPEHSFFNATDLLEKLISENHKVIHYPIKKYWLDIGKHDDYQKAQKDVINIRF